MRQSPSPFLSDLFAAEYPSLATFHVDTRTAILPSASGLYQCASLDRRINCIVRALKAHPALKDVTSGNVAVCKENHFDVVILAVAIARAGFVPVVVSDANTDFAVGELMKEAAPLLAVVGGRFTDKSADNIKAVYGDLPIYTVNALGSDADTQNSEKVCFAPKTRDPDALMLVTHSSGTTGVPKLVCHSASSMRGATAVELSPLPLLQIRKSDVVLANISFFHSRAFCWTFAQLKWEPRRSYAIGSYDYRNLISALSTVRPTIFESLPNVMARNKWAARDHPEVFSGVVNWEWR